MSLLKLPHWAIVDKFPAFYDTESATAIEQTARLYAKINELVESYNKYCEDINKAIEDYEAANDKDYNCFIKTVIKLISDYIGMVDLKIIQHDRKWTEYYNAFTTEIIKTTKNIIAELKENGELDQAILEAVGELETKFETFKAEVKKTVTELNDSAIVFKEKLDLQYDEFVSNANETAERLENEYTETKAALNTEYQNTKAALDSEYQNTKAALDSDYRTTKSALENDYQTVKDNLEELVDTKIQIKHTNNPVYKAFSQEQFPPIITSPLLGDITPPIDYYDDYKYLEVYVDDYAENGGRCVICTARFYEDDETNRYLHITGATTMNVSPMQGMCVASLLCVNLKCSFNGSEYLVIENSSCSVDFIEGIEGATFNTRDIYEIKGVK